MAEFITKFTRPKVFKECATCTAINPYLADMMNSVKDAVNRELTPKKATGEIECHDISKTEMEVSTQVDIEYMNTSDSATAIRFGGSAECPGLKALNLKKK